MTLNSSMSLKRNLKIASATLYGVALVAIGAQAVSLIYQYKDWVFQKSAEIHLRKSLSSIVVEVAPDDEPSCRGATYCFQYRGVNYAGQLERGVIWQGERIIEPST